MAEDETRTKSTAELTEESRRIHVEQALTIFHEICRDKNNPAHPCRDCPIWSICGTLPGSLSKDIIEAAAEKAAAYIRQKREAQNAETALQVQPGAE